MEEVRENVEAEEKFEVDEKKAEEALLYIREVCNHFDYCNDCCKYFCCCNLGAYPCVF